MSITDSRKVDMVATRAGSRVVKLIIADHLGWDDLDFHAKLLQDKVNTYLDFIDSGQLSQSPAVDTGVAPEVCIMLALQFPPTPEAEVFLNSVGDFLAGQGIELEVDVRGSPN